MTLQASQLALTRGNSPVFKGLGFELGPGEALRVAGRNGSGKTSLLRVLCGLLSPTEGQVLWRGRSIRRHREAFLQDLVYIGHGQGLKDDLSALENVQISARLSGQPHSRAAVLAALAQLGLSSRAHWPVRALSQGQRRRVALARLVLTPRASAGGRLLVLDEPFVALDQEAVAGLSALLAQQLAGGDALVYTTHQTPPLMARQTHELHLGDGELAEAL